LDRDPLEILWTTVKRQAGPALGWHINNLYNHERRYLADLQLMADLAPPGMVLELGSAPCHMTALLKLSGYATVGVDVNPDRVAGLIQELGLDVRQCDIERSPLPFADDAFGCVLLCETFEHLRIDPAFVLSEINRVMAPQAFLVITTPNVYSLPSLGRFLLGRSIADPLEEYGKLRNVGHMGHVREYSAREVARFLEALGLAVQSISYRYYAHPPGWKGTLLRIAYRLAPRRFRRDIVIVARKVRTSPRLAPLVPTTR
jgi:SAM-dependent methyltransferase